MTARREMFTVGAGSAHEAQEAAKAHARAEGHRVRTVARIAPDGDGWRVELVVDGAPTTDVGASVAGQGGGGHQDGPPPARSWVAEAREEAIAWRADHTAKGRRVMTTPAVDRAARRFKRSMQRIADESGGTVTMRAGDGPEVTVAAPRTDGEVTDATDGGFWGELVTGPESPLSFQTSRKGLSSALTRTQHAHSGDEARPVLQSWWLTVAGDALTIHTADNYRLARATVSIASQADGWFGIHRSEGKALLAFLASGPDDVAFEAGDGAWSVHHEDGRLTGRLSPGTPPDWSSITDHETADIDIVRYALNGRFASDAAKAATGASGIVLVDYVSADRPTVWHSDGYSEWVMPVRVGLGAPPAAGDDDDPPSHQDDTP